MSPCYRLIISCPDQVGLVAQVSQFIASHKGSILEADHHTDLEQKWFFMRYEIDAAKLTLNLADFRNQFAPIAQKFQMQWQIHDVSIPKRVVLLVSKQSHCLIDLLHRVQEGELFCKIPCVISNHEDLRKIVEWYGIEFHHVPIESAQKEAGFTKIENLLAQHNAEVIVLARYMQIMPHHLCQKYAGKMLNIHHSFLPSFVGAKPYHQAYARGVKLIGATCHYVTAELDQGPIIEQDVARVNHRATPEDFIRLGRDIEKNVLARGLRYHLEDRILIQGNKTVVFA